MAITTLKRIAAGEYAQKRLNEALANWLTEELQRPVSKAKARKLIMAGAVFLDGRRVTIPSEALSSGAAIEARIDLAKLFGDSTSRDREFELTANRILFEDEDLIFVDKPPGLPAQPTLDEARDNLFVAVGRFLARRGTTPYIGVHHRLDRDTSGVVLFTKSRRVNAAVANSFSKHSVTKTYQAITISALGSSPKREWTIQNTLGRIGAKSKRSKYGAVRSDGNLAETFFRIIEEHPRGLWVEAIPRTGRTHQIRVHLAEYGLPILGDDLYGVSPPGIDGLAPRLMLHAVQLVLPHPVTAREISVSSPLPGDFQQCLQRIRRTKG